MNIKEQAYNKFNSEGKLLQVEYGLEAANSGYQIVSVLSTDSIVNVSKKLPKQPLSAEEHNSIHRIADNIYMNITGLPADIDHIVNRVKILAAAKEYEFGCQLTPDILCRSLADKFQTFIQRSGRRAPAFAATIFGFDNENPILYYNDLSAVDYACNAATAGENSGKIQKYLEKHFKKGDTPSAVEIAISAILEAIGKEAESTEIQVAVLSKDGMKILKDDEVDKILQNIAEKH